MGSVVLFDTALETIETACTKSDFVHMITVVVIVVVAVDLGITLKNR